jgi:hypothetical protein
VAYPGGQVRHVRGILFVDYVRMLRRLKHMDWSTCLSPPDVTYLQMKIDPDAWYPMSTFERFGEQILIHVAQGHLAMVQMWGRYSAGQLRAAHPNLLEPGDPIETMRRFHVMRQTFFDFGALELPLVHQDEAELVIRYHMGKVAEEAASHQTLGFFEGLLELAGAHSIKSRFRERSWAGDKRTLAELHWTPPSDSN